ncbi:tyrosine-type recombinase/integrase (plasmid) [Limosilactobacillus reuteri]|uniref:Tyrosine-type recombinase/integrase n=1 Tax=Limosilactobacillus reuteri TaxID=1598 RepID=A0A517D8G0_LIMRT|nr:tyrosine-type recombinase/integrase [Limosilactobacillus reuteri]QDR73638.1 tyrosine-type recombinase/integrase [Limosilactobacillus reuteri]
MKQLVLPIKDSQILQQVLETLRDNFKYGQRNYTLFQVGKATLLRVSDVIALKKSDVFDDQDRIMRNAYIVDKKTKKQNTLYLRPVRADLLTYQNWLMKYQMHNPNIKVYDSPWLFPSFANPDNHITGHTYYEVMQKVGDLLGLNYLGTHTMRKTGAYRVYEQSNHNIGLVMKLLNHSSEAVTLNYLGLDQETREMILDNIDFGGLR